MKSREVGHMQSSLFIDSINNISLTEGVMRFDMVLLAPVTETSGEKSSAPDVDKVCTVATSLQGFLRIHEQMIQVVSRLQEQGLIKKAEPN